MPNPITCSALTVFADDTNRTAYSTLSISPSANKLIIAAVGSTIAAGTGPNEPTLSGNGITWVKITGLQETNANVSRLTVFRGLVTSPSAGVLTADFAGQTQTTADIIVDELSFTNIAGTNGSGAIVQAPTPTQVSGTQSSITQTLAAFTDVANATLGYFRINRGIVQVVGSGFTDVGNTGGAASSLQAEFKSTNDTSVDVSFVSGTTIGIGIGIEIRANIFGQQKITYRPSWVGYNNASL